MISLPQIEKLCLNNNTVANVGIEQINIKVYYAPFIIPFME